jgi:uncharacterized protein (UPF0335 family)
MVRGLTAKNAIKQSEVTKVDWKGWYESLGIIKKNLNDILDICHRVKSREEKTTQTTRETNVQEVYNALKSVGFDLDKVTETEYQALIDFIDQNRELILERSKGEVI